jgi:hypothetical protein
MKPGSALVLRSDLTMRPRYARPGHETADGYFHRYSAAARCVPPTAAAKYLARDDIGGAMNAVARQHFRPLQGFEFIFFFRRVPGRAGTPAQDSFSNARTGFFLTMR